MMMMMILGILWWRVINVILLILSSLSLVSTPHAAIIQLQTKDFDDYDKMHLIYGLLEYQIKNSDHQEPLKSPAGKLTFTHCVQRRRASNEPIASAFYFVQCLHWLGWSVSKLWGNNLVNFTEVLHGGFRFIIPPVTRPNRWRACLWWWHLPRFWQETLAPTKWATWWEQNNSHKVAHLPHFVGAFPPPWWVDISHNLDDTSHIPTF